MEPLELLVHQVEAVLVVEAAVPVRTAARAAFLLVVAVVVVAATLG